MNDKAMNDRETVDVLIAGGGVAGVAAAAALSQLGLDILIIEPGPSFGRRLAGNSSTRPALMAFANWVCWMKPCRWARPSKVLRSFPRTPRSEPIA